MRRIELQQGKQGIVLLHGYPLDSRMWRSQIEAFRNDYFVFAPNFCGFGEANGGDLAYGPSESQSMVLPAGNLDWQSMGELADSVAQTVLSKEFSAAVQVSKWIVCGLSMGGYVALEMWRRHPEVFSGLILTNTKDEADDLQAIATRETAISKAMTLGSDAVTAPMLPRLLCEANTQSKPDLVEQVKAMMACVPVKTIVRAQQAMINRADFSSLVSAISLPTLVIAGASDVITPVATMQRMASSIPQSEFKVIENAGHLSPMENPKDWNKAVLNFASKVSAKSLGK